MCTHLWPIILSPPCIFLSNSLFAVIYLYTIFRQQINISWEADIIVHDDVIKWKHLARYWPFVRGIHRSPVNSPHKGQWRGALICAWINVWVNNREAGDLDLRRHHAHYYVIVMTWYEKIGTFTNTLNMIKTSKLRSNYIISKIMHLR